MSWDRNSVLFKLGVRLLWDPDGFPSKYHDERIQFQKLYDWLKSNVDFEKDVFISTENLDTQSPYQWTVHAENDTDVEQSTKADLSKKVTKTDKTTKKYGIQVGYEYNLEFEAKCLFGGSKSTHKFKVDANWEQGWEHTESEEVAYGQVTEIRVPAQKTLLAKCTLTPFQGSTTAVVKLKAFQRNPSDSCHIVMNYNDWYVNLSGLSDPDKEFELRFSLTMTEYHYDLKWQYALTGQVVPNVLLSQNK